MGETNDFRYAFIDAALWHGPVEEADAILAAHPEIASSDIHTAAILGDDAAVKRFLATDRSNATAKGEPRGWDALTYLCFSKYLRLDPDRTDGFVRSAAALLEAGADANTGFMSEDHQPHPTVESALYGAAGVAHHPELTRLLLEHGADPNDGEVAYHSPETLDNRAIKVLVESGKLTPDSLILMISRKLDWHDYDGVEWLLDHGAAVKHLSHWGARLLDHALGRGTDIKYFELLLDRGADPGETGKVGKSIFGIAARMARVDVLDLFERRGFRVELQGDNAFLAACARSDQAQAHRIAADDPTLVQRLEQQNPGLLVDFAGSGSTGAVSLMLDLGFNIGAQRTTPSWAAGETALHAAAWRGHLPVVKLLIARGAPLDATHRSGRTPLGVALRALVEQSEWTPNEYTIAIAQALIGAGARWEPAMMTLAAALCLGRMDDAERLARESSAEDRQLALEAAAVNGKVAAIVKLIELGADVNAYNTRVHYHATPLHNAVCSGSLEAVKTLVEAGARPGAEDRTHQSAPLAWAEYFVREAKDTKQYREIANYLRDKS